MNRLISLIAGFAVDDVKSIAQRAKRSVATLAIAGVLAFTTYIFVMAALTIWLAEALGAIGATLTIACITALAAGGLLLWLRAVERRERRRRRAAWNAKATRLAMFAGSAAAASRSKGLLGLAAAVGVAFLLFGGGSGSDEETSDDD